MPRPKKLPSDFIKKYTVRLDRQTLEPHCSKCLSELVPAINPTSSIHDGSHFKCIPCNHDYRLTNEETGEPITLKEAQALLSPTESTLVPPTKPIPTPPPPKMLKAEKPSEKQRHIKQPPEDYEPDNLAIDLLNYIYYADPLDPIDDLAKVKNIDPLQIEHRLDKLQEHDFVEYDHYQYLRSQSPYTLTAKGKEFLVNHPSSKPIESVAKADPPLSLSPTKQIEKSLSFLTTRNTNMFCPPKS